MPKNQTSWSNNDVKPSTGWSGVAKNTDVWTDNDTKNSTKWTPITKNTDAWQPIAHAAQAYPYDSPYMTYDSPLWFYDTLVNNNTLNGLGLTMWSAS